MGTAAKSLLAIAVSALTVISLGTAAQAAAPAGGITVTPAALTLRLAKGGTTATASFNVGNTYANDVTLHFALEAAGDTPAGRDTARSHMVFAAADLAVPANGSATQTLTLHDAAAIAPGSQTAAMVVSYGSMGGRGVGVLPSMRLPVTIIKEDGAVTSLGLTKIAGPSIAMAIPSTTAVTLHNTGNMVAIPHGTVQIVGRGGTVLASGVLNEASRAVAPGTDIKLAANLIKSGNAWLPGPYDVRVTYGLGGDAADSTSVVRFLFIAWWHPFAAGLLAVGAWYLVSHWQVVRPQWYKRRHRETPPPKRRLLIGRDIS